jgi:hypothetical protein
MPLTYTCTEHLRDRPAHGRSSLGGRLLYQGWVSDVAIRRMLETDDIRTATPQADVLADVTTLHRIVELERQREERKRTSRYSQASKNRVEKPPYAWDCGQ